MYAYLHAHTVTASLHLSKGRTTRRVRGGGGVGRNAEKKTVQVKRKMLKNVHAERQNSCTANDSKKNNVQEQNDLAPLFIFSDSASDFTVLCGGSKGGGGGREKMTMNRHEGDRNCLEVDASVNSYTLQQICFVQSLRQSWCKFTMPNC